MIWNEKELKFMDTHKALIEAGDLRSLRSEIMTTIGISPYLLVPVACFTQQYDRFQLKIKANIDSSEIIKLVLFWGNGPGECMYLVSIWKPRIFINEEIDKALISQLNKHDILKPLAKEIVQHLDHQIHFY